MATFKLRNATGNTVPPTEEANEMIPKAVECLLLNQWATMLVTSPKATPQEIYKQSKQLAAGCYRAQEVVALTPTPKP